MIIIMYTWFVMCVNFEYFSSFINLEINYEIYHGIPRKCYK